MKKALPTLALVAVVLVLAGLYVASGHLASEQEATLAGLKGDDELTRALQLELAGCASFNRRSQRIILTVAGGLAAVALIGWGAPRLRHNGAETGEEMT